MRALAYLFFFQKTPPATTYHLFCRTRYGQGQSDGIPHRILVGEYVCLEPRLLHVVMLRRRHDRASILPLPSVHHHYHRRAKLSSLARASRTQKYRNVANSVLPPPHVRKQRLTAARAVRGELRASFFVFDPEDNGIRANYVVEMDPKGYAGRQNSTVWLTLPSKGGFRGGSSAR